MGGSPLNQNDQWPLHHDHDHDQDQSKAETVGQLPSRKVTHRRPKSFLEKPIFPLILFIVFIVVLCSILITYLYDHYQSTEEKKPIKNTAELDVPKSSSKPIGEIQPPKDQDNIPVVTIPTSSDQEEDTELISDDKEETKDMDNIIHIVQEKENLFRIALKYYNNGSKEYREIIKQANGLSDDTIKKGMQLIIPSPLNHP